MARLKPNPAPVLFLSHGSPMIGIEQDPYTEALEALGTKLNKPQAIVVVSAHWETRSVIAVTGSAKPSLIYDFGGFPDELYQLPYPCPGAPALARDIVALLHGAGISSELDIQRGLDHAVWIPLRRLFPAADIPVVQVSLPVPRTPQAIYKVGETLSILRCNNILLIGSGGIVHNLGLLNFGEKKSPVDVWAKEFDEWVELKLEKKDIKGLMSYQKDAPHASRAVPQSEHFDPLFFSLGAAADEPLTPIYEGFHYGNLSMRSFRLG